MSPDQLVLEDFINKRPFAAAQALEQLNDDAVAAFIQELPVDKSLKLLDFMNANKAAKCFMLLPPQLHKTLLENSSFHLRNHYAGKWIKLFLKIYCPLFLQRKPLP